MPDCEQVLAHMGEFLDRRLTADEQAQVEEHLQSCEVCARAFHWEDSILKVCRECAAEDVPPGLADRISDACREHDQPGP